MALRPEHLWAPETNPQLRPCHLDGHRDKTSGTRWVLYTIWLCCSCNKLLVRLARGELSPRLSLVSPKVFFLHSVTDGSFGSLPLSPLACLVGGTSFPAISSTLLHRYYINWTELGNYIIQFNNERRLTKNVVFNLVTLHYWHIILLFWYWKVVLT